MARTSPGPAGREFDWQGREEGVTYLTAVVSYVALGVFLRTAVLNWIVGPLYFVCFVWAASRLLEHRRDGR